MSYFNSVDLDINSMHSLIFGLKETLKESKFMNKIMEVDNKL